MPYVEQWSGDEWLNQIRWDARGNPYQILKNGQKVYISPVQAATMVTPPGKQIWDSVKGEMYTPPAETNPVKVKLAEWAKTQGGASYDNPGAGIPERSFAHARGGWDQNTGEYKKGSFWDSTAGDLTKMGLFLGGGAAGAYATGAMGAESGITATGGVTTGGVGPLAGGYGAATTQFAVPSSIAATSAGGGTAAGVGAGMNWDLAMKGVGLGTNFLGNYLSGKSDEEMSAAAIWAHLLETQQQREDTQRASLASYLAGEQASDENTRNIQAGRGLEATQMDPYKHAKARNAANIKRSFVEGTGGNPNQRMTSGFDVSALSPESLNENADYFYSNAAAAQPNVPVPNGKAESFRQNFLKTTDQEKAEMRRKIMEYLQQIGGPVQNTPPRG